MNSITNLSVKQLLHIAKIKTQIESLENKLGRILDAQSPSLAPQRRRKMSAAGRARIIAAQKARWAKAKGKTASKAHKPKRKMSAAARRKIAAAAKTRWAKAKAAGRNRL